MPSQQAQSTGRVDEAVICNRSSFRICEAQPSWGGRWPVVGFLVCSGMCSGWCSTKLEAVENVLAQRSGG